MRILFVTIAWPNPGGGNIYSDLMKVFKDRGHEVYVLCKDGRQASKGISMDDENGICVLRANSLSVAKVRNPIRKFIALTLLGISFNKAYNRYFSQYDFDLIIFPTPPITLSLFLRKLKKRNNAIFYLLLKDIWPREFSDLKVIKEDGLIWKYFRWHEKRLYSISDYIGCMSPMGVEYLCKMNPGIPESKVEVCPNAIKVPVESQKRNNEIRKKYTIPLDSTVFLFSGNLSRGHGIEFLARNIIALGDYRKAFFVIGGAGTHFDVIKNALINAGTNNFLIYSYLPKEEFEELNANCDVGIILLDSLYTYPQFPSRILTYLKNSMPALCAVNDATDMGKIVDKNKCGLSFQHGDDMAFQRNVRYICENPVIRKEMGENAWNLLRTEYDVEKAYMIIMRHFK